MSDFLQKDPISTLHLLAERDPASIEMEIEEACKTRPIALVLPSLISEMQGPALGPIMEVLESLIGECVDTSPVFIHKEAKRRWFPIEASIDDISIFRSHLIAPMISFPLIY